MRIGRWTLCCLCLVPVPAAVAATDEEPESARLSDAIFRRGLQERGLTDLLEFYLAEYPPSDAIEALLLRRELKLAQHADETRSESARQEALRDGDEILLHLIREYAEDIRQLEWRLEYIRSLLYRHAEPHYLRILYGSGKDTDRERVRVKAGRAIEEIGYFISGVEKELERLDKLGVREYERLERRGYIDQLESMKPQADYLRWWAMFYRALACRESDPYRERELRALLQELRQPNGALVTPHETSHIQAQAQLLTGMTSRLLHDYGQAVILLNSAIATVSTISDPAERQSLQWVVTLAMLERVRALRDDHEFDAALDRLEDFRDHASLNAAGDFRINLLIGLLERSIWRAQAQRAARSGHDAQARRYRDRAARSLEALADENTTYRDEVYGALVDRLSADEEIESLPALEQSALLAGLLRQTTDLQARTVAAAEAGGSADRDALITERMAVLDRAITLADLILSADPPVADKYRAEVIFNLAVAHYHRGQRREACERFLAVGRDFPWFGRAAMASLNAVQLASELYRDSSLRSQPEVQALYLDALRIVTEQYGHVDEARYWQFFLAQTLEELERFGEAAAAYARVHEGHENYIQALSAAVRCRAEAVKRETASSRPDRDAITREAAEVAAAIRRLSAGVERAQPTARDVALLRRLEARAIVDAGEVLILPGVDQPQAALDLVDGYERRFPDEKALLGRILRVRVIAFEALGRLSEAEAVIPRYVRSDPVNAGPTLQGLFDSIREDIDRLDAADRMDDANEKARSALMLARQIREWALQREPPLPAASLYAVNLQLAESFLRAGRVEKALAVFGDCLDVDAERNDDGQARDLRAIFGRGECFYRLGRYEEALPLFNRIVRGSVDRTETWWLSLLRDLQCRTAMESGADGILKVIRQHRVLDVGMGGAALRAQFDELERQNEDRLSSVS